MANNVKVEMIGEWKNIPEEAKNIFKAAIKETSKNTGMILNFAMNYGGRDEIIRGIKKFVQSGKDISELNENNFN